MRKLEQEGKWRTAAAKGPHLSQPTLVGCWPGSGDPEEEAGLPTSAVLAFSRCPAQSWGQLAGPSTRGSVPQVNGNMVGSAYPSRLSLLGCDLGI